MKRFRLSDEWLRLLLPALILLTAIAASAGLPVGSTAHMVARTVMAAVWFYMLGWAFATFVKFLFNRFR